ncbi:hypothetical protein AM500_12925 [Bacillus sp. FJAT-18017]|uniref:hypothetical protein n=1 Tax=Bacillus sp. FJAT-18017 TaxID=1705566 RepID=UPI0006B06C5A|nr:hypothetical protein [Bacillus sp. FJAT-18017]ALC90588.1 hypothetical protein AM500_12925 [Bacillus sp. FJAT-18017]
MSIEGFVTILLDIIGLWLGIQWVYALTVLLLGNVMVDYYDYGTIENPINILDKIINFILKFTIGVGPCFYKKLRFKKKYNWFTWRLAFLGGLLGGGLVALIVFEIINAAKNFIF